MESDIPRLVVKDHVVWDKAEVENVGRPLELGAFELVIYVSSSFYRVTFDDSVVVAVLNDRQPNLSPEYEGKRLVDR